MISLEPLKDTSKPADETMVVFDPLLTIPGCTPSTSAVQYAGSTSWLDAWRGSVLPLILAAANGGAVLADGSRIITTEHIKDAATRQKLAETIAS
jgi:hypothetical protein